MQINFLTVPEIQSDEFFRLAKSLLGIDLSTRLPKAPNYLANLALLKGIDNFDSANPGSLLRHLSYSVIIKDATGSINEIQSESCLHTLRLGETHDGEALLLLTGNLVDLRSEVINGCSDNAASHFREFTTKLLLRLDEQGLGSIFQNYARKIKPHTKSLILVPERRNGS